MLSILLLLPTENSDAHWTDLIGSEFMLVLCGGGFLMTLIRAGSADWGQLYPGFFGKALEFGGAVGTVFIGAIADFAVKHVCLISILLNEFHIVICATLYCLVMLCQDRSIPHNINII